MNRLCEQCGSDNARLYCRWPAVLCVGCAEKRSAAGEAEATNEAKEAPLYSLANLHRRRTSLAKHQGQSEPVRNVDNCQQNENANVDHGQQIEPPAKPKPIVPMDVLARLDNVFRAARSLKDDSPLDALHIANGLLHALLRLAYAKAQSKPTTNPDPDLIPMKLFQKGIMAKPTMQRFRKTMEGQSVASILECCHDVFLWLASDDTARIGSVAKAR
jgi:hypothetical protein